jgi:hypothetical protein
MSAITTKSCQAPIQQGPRKGTICGNKTTGTYCEKHARHAVYDHASSDHIRYCDVARGCYVVLEEHQSKCTSCLHAARIRDRKRNDKKRQDDTLCLDCGNKLTEKVRAKGKHDKPLRRCIPCYEKLQAVEKARVPRERNYKAEAFANKHVIWNHYVKGAKKRGIHFGLTKTQFESMIIQPCFYCDYCKEGEVNGVDRKNNQEGYVESNVVPCCQTCNQAKGAQHPQEFVDKLQAIHLYRTIGIPIQPGMVEKWKTTYCSRTVPSYRTYQKSANQRNLEFSLTEEEFIAITKQSCYLCGLEESPSHHNGIDRVENHIGYRLDNSKPCCGHCNLLKKTMALLELYQMTTLVSAKYVDITAILSATPIPMRESKVAPRERVTHNLISQEPIPMEYKSTEEKVDYSKVTPVVVAELLEKKEEPSPLPKQWKTKQIYHALHTGHEQDYKTYCEEHNDLSLPTWSADWTQFVLSTRGLTEAEATPLIAAFVENLRRIRHNHLCHEKNASIVDKEDRQQWPATTVVRAFLDGKLDRFKTFTEASTNENPADPKWVKRWDGFVASLEASRDQPQALKTLCSKFMTAQRTKKYRHQKGSGAGKV